MPTALELLAVPLLIAVSAFFVAAEYAVVAIRAGQVEELRKKGWRYTAQCIASLKGQPALAIAALQICLTVSSLLLGSLGEPVMFRLLEAALEEPALRLPRATALVDYHVHRNEGARASHAKTWRAKHRGVKFLRL